MPTPRLRALCRWLMLSLAGLLLAACGLQQQSPLAPADAAQETAFAPAATLVRIGVCWEAVPLVEDLLAAYEPEGGEVVFDLVRGTSAAIAELAAAHQVDLAVAGQPRSDGAPALSGAGAAPQPDWAGAGLQARVLTLDAVAIVVNPALGLTDLPPADVAALLAGERSDWAGLGSDVGAAEPAILSPGAIARDVLDAALLPGGEPASTAAIVPHDTAMAAFVREHPAGIGYLSRAYLDGSLRALTLDSASLSTEAIQRGTYPLTYEIVALTHSDTPTAAMDLLAYAATSRGRRAMAERYVLPQ